MAMVEPFLSVRPRRPGRQPARSGLGDPLDPHCLRPRRDQRRTWLKVPVVDDMHRVLDATTLPTLLLGGDPGPDPAATLGGWRSALAHPSAVGLVVGRALLFPQDDDVAAAVDAAAELVHG
jgi:hypothetical protein